jgi:hypothetical protein
MANDLKFSAPQAASSKTRNFQRDPKLDMSATWVRAAASSDPDRHFGVPVLSELFRRVASELKKAGFSVIDDINTEPLEGYGIIACLEVYRKPSDGARTPEELGMISLYSKEGKPAIMKLSPWAPGSSAEFLDALAKANESLIESLASHEGRSELQVQVHAGHSPSFK